MNNQSAEAPPGARRDPSRLGWPYRIAAVCIALIAAFLWLGVQICGLGENRSELYNDRCRSVVYRNLPLLGFVVLGLGTATAKLMAKRRLAWVVLLMALIPGLITWKLFSV